ncbi:MAG: efflux RND transporter permease subunit [Gammaproteobacteria bacterium]|nr:efflux RND transporter permease subunit [Gammaproteobacteria bacterium]
MNLAEISIRNPLLGTIGMIVALAGGLLAYQNMPRFEDPEFTIRVARITTEYPGASPQEVMNEVTEPLETALQQLSEVESLNSISIAGKSEISVEIRYAASRTRADLQLAWKKVRNKIDEAQRHPPPGTGKSIVNDDFGEVYGIYYLLAGEGFSPVELMAYAEGLRRDLLLVDGVAKVRIIGGQEEAIFIEFSQERVAASGIFLNQVYNTLVQQNSVSPAGEIILGDERIHVQPTGDINSVEALRSLVVSSSSSDSVTRLGQIANIERGYIEPVKQYIRYNGQPALGIGIANVPGANVVKIGNAVDRKLAEIGVNRPVGIALHEFYHQGKVVDSSIRSFGWNVVAALVIVFATLVVFMGFRSGVVMGATVLLTMAATLFIMWVAGIPMHRISLGALVISLGMLVDNGVVVTDAIQVGLEKGRNTLEVAKEAASKNFKPLLAGTIVGILAFAPVGFAPGDTAEFTGSLFWVVLISLSLSWVLAFTVTPLLCHWIFPQSARKPDTPVAGEKRFLQAYRGLIRAILSRRYFTLFGVLGIFLLSVWGFQFVKAGFFPASTSPQIVVDFFLPEGTGIERTRNDVVMLEEHVKKLDGVEHVQTLIGEGALRYMLIYEAGSPSASKGQLLVRTVRYQDNDRLIREIQAHVDEAFPDAQAKAWKFQLGPGGGSKIEAKFSGPDPGVLRGLASQAKTIMAADGEAVLIKDDWRRQVPVIQPVYSQNKGERLGITRKAVSEALDEHFDGRQRGLYREGDNLIPIISRSEEKERLEPWSLPSVQVISQISQKAVPIAQVIDGGILTWRDARLLRTNRILSIKVQCDPALGVYADDLFSRLKPRIEAIDLPEGYSLQWEGEFGDSAEAQTNLASTVPLAILAMVLVVIVLFNAIRQPIVIWSVVPLGIVGVVCGLLLTEKPLEFMGMLGLLSLSGLLIQNSVVLVDCTDRIITSGVPRFDALIEAAASRLRPVTMGALTTVLGVLPLYFDAFFRSMSVVLMFGLSFATFITLLVTPVLYSLLFRINSNETAA